MVKKISKKAAMEMSIGTIVIIVIAVTMLILGLVFVRSIMCGAIGLTGDLNDRVKGEINDLFGAVGGEVQCIGSTGEPVKIEPGKTNIIYCGIKAPQEAQYKVSAKGYSAIYSSEREIEEWLRGEDSWSGTVAPGDDLPKKVLRLAIPDQAPEDSITIQLEIQKKDKGSASYSTISTQDLDFEISRTGVLKAAMC